MGQLLSSVEAFFTPPEKLVTIEHEKFLIRNLIAEGGFSYVYLVETFTEPKARFALKRILIQSEEQKREAESEILVHQRLGHHRNLVSLLKWAIMPSAVVPGARDAVLLFPLYHRGTLDACIRHRAGKSRKGASGFSQAEVLQIFLGMCAGLRVFHRHQPPFAHRDVCPRNVLLDNDDRPVLMDFGSAAPAKRVIGSRREALALEEEASRHCSMPFRAPELFNVASECVVDERVDIWSLGCSLFAMSVGVGLSPFEQSGNGEAAGGSVALAAMNGRWSVPEGFEGMFSSEFIHLIGFMLEPDQSVRPRLDAVVERANLVLAKYPA